MPGGANVQVSYNSSANPAWVFSPDSATVNQSGNVVFTAAPNSPWKFTNCNIKSDPDGIFGTPSINPAGNQMMVSDSCPHANGIQRFQYTVTVLPNGQNQTPVTSPDPEIVNDPSSPMPAPKPPK